MMDLAEHRAFDAHGVVVARTHVGRRIVVVDDIDAADESDAPVDDDKLAMQAPQAVALKVKAADFRAVEQRAHAGLGQAGAKVFGEIAGAKTVDRNIHRDPASRRRA
jgi:hypothetical protein